MELSEFKEFIQIYGANIDKWPTEQRNAARNWLGDIRADEALSNEKKLDAMLDSYHIDTQTNSMIHRVLQKIGEHDSGPTLWQIFAKPYERKLIPMLCLAAIGFYLGITQAEQLIASNNLRSLQQIAPYVLGTALFNEDGHAA